ncbi:MAG: hypothetical protein GXO23_03820 [Crenarchaeota archaeon]|nr:hypothetical protein [Thermoproteota archaeon]
MRKVSAILSIREDFTRNLIHLELASLADLYGVTIEDVDLENRKAVLAGDISQIFEMTCRSIFVKSLITEDLSLTYPRSFLVKGRSLEKVDTASSPLEVVLSRLLLNISRVKYQDRVLDPFSGVGGILFEARMLGAHVIGIDIVERYLKTQRKNVDGDLLLSDSSCMIPLRRGSIDAVVSDPPYSKLSIIDVDLDLLYRNLAKICAIALKRGGRAAVSCICSIPLEDYLEEEGLLPVSTGYQYVHKTLIRKIVCVEKI